MDSLGLTGAGFGHMQTALLGVSGNFGNADPMLDSANQIANAMISNQPLRIKSSENSSHFGSLMAFDKAMLDLGKCKKKFPQLVKHMPKLLRENMEIGDSEELREAFTVLRAIQYPGSDLLLIMVPFLNLDSESRMSITARLQSALVTTIRLGLALARVIKVNCITAQKLQNPDASNAKSTLNAVRKQIKGSGTQNARRFYFKTSADNNKSRSQQNGKGKGNQKGRNNGKGSNSRQGNNGSNNFRSNGRKYMSQGLKKFQMTRFGRNNLGSDRYIQKGAFAVQKTNNQMKFPIAMAAGCTSIPAFLGDEMCAIYNSVIAFNSDLVTNVNVARTAMDREKRIEECAQTGFGAETLLSMIQSARESALEGYNNKVIDLLAEYGVEVTVLEPGRSAGEVVSIIDPKLQKLDIPEGQELSMVQRAQARWHSNLTKILISPTSAMLPMMLKAQSTATDVFGGLKNLVSKTFNEYVSSLTDEERENLMKASGLAMLKLKNGYEESSGGRLSAGTNVQRMEGGAKKEASKGKIPTQAMKEKAIKDLGQCTTEDDVEMIADEIMNEWSSQGYSYGVSSALVDELKSSRNAEMKGTTTETETESS